MRTSSHETSETLNGSPYQYGEAWKLAVDKSGEDWRAYCEARACLRQYFARKNVEGKESAMHELKKYLSDRHITAGRRAKLEADFILVGQHEGAEIEAAACLDKGEMVSRVGFSGEEIATRQAQ